jgi:hypothetical protein
MPQPVSSTLMAMRVEETYRRRRGRSLEVAAS